MRVIRVFKLLWVFALKGSISGVYRTSLDFQGLTGLGFSGFEF